MTKEEKYVMEVLDEMPVGTLLIRCEKGGYIVDDTSYEHTYYYEKVNAETWKVTRKDTITLELLNEYTCKYPLSTRKQLNGTMQVGGH